jgi:hypothetical protein
MYTHITGCVSTPFVKSQGIPLPQKETISLLELTMKIKQTLCTTSKIWKKNAVVSGNSRD